MSEALLQAATAAGATLVKAQAPPVSGKGAAVTTKTAGGSGAAGPSTTPDNATNADITPGEPPLVALVSGDDGDFDADAGSGEGDPQASEGGDTATTPAGAEAALPAQTFAPLTADAATPAQAASAPPPSASAADLAAQMSAKVSGGASRFTLSLNPLGLGQVDVTVSIGADRQLTAALSFSDPQAAHAMSAHAAELKGALEKAGFTVPNGGFDFTSASGAAAPSAGGAGWSGGFGAGGDGGHDSGARAARAAFGAGEALGRPDTAGDGAWTSSGDSRLDIRI